MVSRLVSRVNVQVRRVPAMQRQVRLANRTHVCTSTDRRVHVFFLKQVHTNLIWALGYNIVAIPLAAGAFLPGWGVMLSPAFAGAIMSCSSVAVVTNSLLLRRTLARKLNATSK